MNIQIYQLIKRINGFYYLIPFLAVWVLPVQTSSQNLKITFSGNEAFEITDGTNSLVTDFPYRSGYSGYMEYESIRVGPAERVLSLITHGHPDHFEPGLFERTNWYLLGPGEIKTKMPPERRLALSDTVHFVDLTIIPIATPHSNVEHYSYLVQWHGLSLYFSGDTESVQSLENARKVDALFISPWLFHLAKQQNVKISARTVIIYHHEPGEEINCTECLVPEQGETIILKTEE